MHACCHLISYYYSKSNIYYVKCMLSAGPDLAYSISKCLVTDGTLCVCVCVLATGDVGYQSWVKTGQFNPGVFVRW